MENDFEWPYLICWTKFGRTFYLFQEYISGNKTFHFIPMISGHNEGGGGNYKAKLTIYDINDSASVENEISFTSPVLPIEDFPKSKDERAKCDNVWKVQSETMLKSFAKNVSEPKGEDGWKKFDLKVSIYFKSLNL